MKTRKRLAGYAFRNGERIPLYAERVKEVTTRDGKVVYVRWVDVLSEVK